MRNEFCSTSDKNMWDFAYCNFAVQYRRKLKVKYNIPDSKVNGANMGPIWGRQDPGGTHVGPMNFAIWDATVKFMKANVILSLTSHGWVWWGVSTEESRPRFNIKTVFPGVEISIIKMKPSYLYDVNIYTGKTISLCWNSSPRSVTL